MTKEKLEQIIASTSDDDIIEIYRVRKDGKEWKTPAEMDDLIRQCADPLKIYVRTRALEMDLDE